MTTIDRPAVRDDDAVRTEIDREMSLIESAARMVSTGGATRVTLGNLPLAGAVVEVTHKVAAHLRVRIVPIFGVDGSASAVIVDQEPSRDA